MFFIKIAAFLAYLEDVNIDFVVIFLYTYTFLSSFYVFFFSTLKFLHIDKM